MWSAMASSLNLDDAYLDNELVPRHGMTTWQSGSRPRATTIPCKPRSLLQGWQDTLGDVFTR